MMMDEDTTCPPPLGELSRNACVFHLRGRCRKGSKCPFSHATDAVRARKSARALS